MLLTCRPSQAPATPTLALALVVALALATGCMGVNDWTGDGTTDPVPPGSDPLPGPGPGDPSGGPGSDPGDPPTEPTAPTDPGLPSCFDAGFVPDPGTAGAGVDVGGPCEVTAECRGTLLCLEGECVAPGQEGAWCDGIDIACPYDGSTCVAGTCVFTDGACAQNVDCPAGYLCEEGECAPAEGDCYLDTDCPAESICDFGTCVSVAECVVSQDLRGRWSARSTMHLGEAASGVLGVVLDATEWIRDLLQGRGGIPGVGFLVDDIIRGYLESTLYPYQIDAIVALGDLSDMLDDTRMLHTMDLDASCRELYRGTLTFERIEVEFRGTIISDRPEDIPRVGAIPPAEFGAVLRCTSLAIDEFRVEHLVGGLIRWVTDAVIQHASEGEYDHVEEALVAVIDCNGLGAEVGGWMGSAVEVACQAALEESVSRVGAALDEAAFDLGRMRLEGEADVPDSNRLDSGHWSGSLVTGDFTGEFSASRI